MPRSTPIEGRSGSMLMGLISTTKLAWYCPVVLRIMVTELGSEGSGLDHFTLKRPNLASSSLLPLRENPVRTNRADCWFSFFLNRGKPTFDPFRLPLRLSKKFLKAAPKF